MLSLFNKGITFLRVNIKNIVAGIVKFIAKLTARDVVASSGKQSGFKRTG